jgi:hypothetical protein
VTSSEHWLSAFGPTSLHPSLSLFCVGGTVTSASPLFLFQAKAAKGKGTLDFPTEGGVTHQKGGRRLPRFGLQNDRGQSGNKGQQKSKAKTQHDKVPPIGGSRQPRTCEVGFGFQEGKFSVQDGVLVHKGGGATSPLRLIAAVCLHPVDRLSSASAVFECCHH